MIRTRRAALAQSGRRLSKKIMRKQQAKASGFCGFPVETAALSAPLQTC
jgi:hypothetical protein